MNKYIKNIRVKIVGSLIDLNEDLFFYPKLKKYFKSVFPEKAKIILDVGCNRGQSIDFFLKLFPDCVIYGFEPNKKLFNYLSKKYKSNPNIKLYQLGVSDTCGTMTFHENIFDQTSTFEEINYDSEYLATKSRVLGVDPKEIFVDSYEVEVTTLAKFINEEVKQSIDIMKVDTEGHEYKCLLGLFGNPKIQHSINFMQLEYHHDDMYAQKISDKTMTELLNKNGYVENGRVKHGFGEFEEVIFKKEE